MKASLIADLIDGFFTKTPKRLVLFQRICIVIAAIVAAILSLQANNIIHLSSFMQQLIGPNGIVGLVIAAGTAQLAKKDPSESNPTDGGTSVTK